MFTSEQAYLFRWCLLFCFFFFVLFIFFLVLFVLCTIFFDASKMFVPTFPILQPDKHTFEALHVQSTPPVVAYSSQCSTCHNCIHYIFFQIGKRHKIWGIFSQEACTSGCVFMFAKWSKTMAGIGLSFWNFIFPFFGRFFFCLSCLPCQKRRRWCLIAHP